MSRIAPLLALALSLTALTTACDINEGPAAELGEAVEAARDGKSTEKVNDELDDVFAKRTDLDKRLDRMDEWLKGRRKALSDGSKELGDDTEAKLKDLEDQLAKARDDVAKGTNDAADKLDAEVTKLEQNLDALFTKKEQ